MNRMMQKLWILAALGATSAAWAETPAPPVDEPEHADVIEHAEAPSVAVRHAATPAEQEGEDVVEVTGDALRSPRAARRQPGAAGPHLSGQPGATGPHSTDQPGTAGPHGAGGAVDEEGRDVVEPLGDRRSRRSDPTMSDAPAGKVFRRPAVLTPYPMHSGVHDGGADWTLAYQDVVHVTDADWVRVYFEDFDLGEASYILLRSLRDDAEQRLDARTIRGWMGSSAFFNGDTVEIELYVAPRERGVFFTLAGVKAGGWIEPPFYRPGVPAQSSPDRTLCGPDNRVASGESRTGRVTYLFGSGLSPGCTAWLLSNGSLATAGHCVDFDPDASGGNCGPQLPDGVVETAFLNGVIEFNVPSSTSGGTPVLSAPEDQFPVDAVSGFNYDGCGQGLGKDWAIFSINRNTTTDENAHFGRGFFRPTLVVPSSGNTIRITGYGTDSGSANQTNQTSTGPYDSHSFSGIDWWHTYQVDTTGGNSGSPIIRVSSGHTIGIHTNGGCQSNGSGANSGTSFAHVPLQVGLNTFPGIGTVYVDVGHSVAAEDGTIYKPYNLVPEGVSTIASNRVLVIVEGSYTTAAGNAPLTIGADGKRMTITAPVGSVRIGN